MEDIDYSESDAGPQMKGGAACVADPELYAILKDLRKQVARRLNLPPYVIFQDPSLEAMATTYPVTPEELLSIPGVGAGKANKHGAEFLEVIRKHVEDNEIIRPEDIRVKSVPKKSNRKIAIIQAIDRKIDLEEVAESQGLDFDEMIGELNSIVEAGTKIDIRYYVDELLDEDQQQEIIDCLRSLQEDDVEEAITQLGADYDEIDIKLVRVMFISEMGN